MTPPRDRRLTASRVQELRDEIARLEQRVGQLEERPDAGELLAHELGQAALRTLRRPSTTSPRPTRGANL